MVGVFLRLKWRLLANGFARSRFARIVTIINLLGGVVIGVLGGATTLALASTAGGARWLPAVFAALFGVWALGPVLMFGADETLDPARLAMLPLRPRQLLPGLLAASLLSIGGITSLLIVAGPAIAARLGPALEPATAAVVVLSCLLVLLMSVAASRVVTTTLSTLLRTRRGRDAVATASLIGGVGIYWLAQFPEQIGDGVGGIDASGVAGQATWGVLQWTPPGQAGMAVALGLDGDGRVALGHLTIALLMTLALAGVWWLSLRRLLDTPGATAPRSRPRLRLVPRALGALPHGRTTAVLSRELRDLGRHAGRRVRAMQQTVYALFPLVSLLGLQDPDPRWVLGAGMVGILAVNESAIQYGSDGRALWAHVATSGSWRADVVGRNLALLIQHLLVGLVVITITAVLTGGWRHALPALLIVPVGAMLAMALGNLMAVRLPFPVPDLSSGNLFGQASGQRPGCLFVLVSLVSLVTVGVVTGLFVGMLWMRADDALFVTAALLTGWCVAGVVWVASVRATADEAQRRGPELLDAVTPR